MPIGDPAFGVLLEACRRWLGPAAGGRDLGEVDWHQVSRRGFFHNLDPLLYRLAEEGRLPAEEIPAEILDTWESAHYRNFLFNSRALEMLEQLSDAARAAGVTFVVFKGPVTMARAYGDPALRIMVDLDLLVRPADLETVGRIAGRLGFAASGRDHLIHTTASHPESGLGLELHFDLYDFLLRRDELVARALEERVELELDGRPFPGCRPEPALVLEIAHLVNEDFRVNLRNWLDLAALLSRAEETPDWGALQAALEAHGVLPEFRLAVEVVSELFAPASVPCFRPSGYPESARRRLIARLASFDGGFERPALQELAYRGGAAGRISYLWRRLVPTGGRWRALAAGRPTGAALAALGRQSARVAARELGRWRAAGVATGADSVKAAVYARHRRRSRRSGAPHAAVPGSVERGRRGPGTE